MKTLARTFGVQVRISIPQLHSAHVYSILGMAFGFPHNDSSTHALFQFSFSTSEYRVDDLPTERIYACIFFFARFLRLTSVFPRQQPRRVWHCDVLICTSKIPGFFVCLFFSVRECVYTARFCRIASVDKRRVERQFFGEPIN